VVYETFFKVEENVLLVQFQFILPNAHPNRFGFRKHESNIEFFLQNRKNSVTKDVMMLKTLLRLEKN